LIDNTFDLVYDDAGVFSAFGEFGFRMRSDLGIFIRGAYHTYNMDNEEKAWHRPTLELSLNSFYIIQERLTLSAGIRSNYGAYARTFDNNTLKAEQIEGWLDLNLGAEYQINKQFSAFLKLNNLLNDGYIKWYNYPVQKFNVLAGVGFSF
jgi:outer membrane receptor for ferric coprogen and ferric-rhodotorulic acid